MKLLLGISGNDRSISAIEWVFERAAALDDDLTVALVDRPGTDVDAEAAVERVRRRFEESGLDPDVRVLEGDPGGQLVALAERESFDQLVIPGGEKSPMGKIELDHLEEYVLLNCRTSVTIVR